MGTIRAKLEVASYCVAAAMLLFAAPCRGNTEICRPSQFRIAVVHGDDPNGNQTWLGVQTAEAETDKQDRVCLIRAPYRGDREGAERLEEMVRSGDANLVIGPTDSGAYLGALEIQDELRSFQVPVISPLVTTAEGNVKDGWFFRTNLNNQQRIAALRDALDPLWISSLGVVYSDTGFGREAAESLRQDLAAESPPVYVTASFEDNPESLREAVKRILVVRPEAVGIFTLAADLPRIFNEIDSQTLDSPYQPIYFALGDARPVIDPAHRLYFVATTTGPIPIPHSDEKLYEVGALAFDTTRAILTTLGGKNGANFIPAEFRDDFEHLQRTGNGWTGRQTGMKFSGFRNVAVPSVFHSAEPAKPVMDAQWGYGERLWRKLNLVYLRFGLWPFLYATLSVMLCVAFTIIDVKRKYEGKYKKVFRHVWIYLLCGSHVVILLALLLLLGETGAISYDNYIAIFALAVAPATLFRTTFLETPAGRSIGVAKLYDTILTSLNNHILNARHPTDTRRIAVLAYYNDEAQILQKLRVAYDQQPEEKREELQAKLDARLHRIDQTTVGMLRILRRRQAHARRIMRWFTWRDLYQSYVPVEYCRRFPENPEGFIGAAKGRCAVDGKLRRKVLGEIKPFLDNYRRDPEKAREAERALAEDIPGQPNDLPGHELYVALQFLVLNFQYKPQDLIDRGWLDPNYRWPMMGLGRRFWVWVKRAFRSTSRSEPAAGITPVLEDHGPAAKGTVAGK